MKILITGFDPFGGETVNPSWDVVNSLPDSYKQSQIFKIQIPTVFEESFEVLLKSWDEIQPHVVVAIGQAGGREALSVERVAINLNDARIADNKGNKPIDTEVEVQGPAAYFSNLPVKNMVNSALKKGVPAELSYTAGTFVCNHIMYKILNHIDKKNLPVKGGFIHVPFLPQQAVGKKGVPSMCHETIRDGILALIDAILENKQDSHESMGREC